MPDVSQSATRESEMTWWVSLSGTTPDCATYEEAVALRDALLEQWEALGVAVNHIRLFASPSEDRQRKTA